MVAGQMRDRVQTFEIQTVQLLDVVVTQTDPRLEKNIGQYS